MSGKETTVLDIREMLRHAQQGRSDREISQALHIARKTVTKYRRWAEQEGLLGAGADLPEAAELHARLKAHRAQTTAPAVTPSSVAPYRQLVLDLRDQGLEIQALYQRLGEQGYRGTYSSVWRFVRQLEPKTPEVTVRVETQPGEEAQVDFGYVGRMFDPATQRVRRAWAFVMTLCWSRHQYVEFVFDQRITTWLLLHEHTFDFFGGVPKRIVLDNLKTAIVYADRDEPAVQRAYRDLAEHYGFLIAPCRVATPQHKGKVENGVHYVQRNFLAGKAFRTVHEDVRNANRQVRGWIMTTAGLRCHGTTKQSPLDRFHNTEWAALLPLPPVRCEMATWKQVKLHRDCYITFDNAYYSAPFRLVGETLWVRATATQVQLYADFQVVATHTRATEPGQRRTEEAHLPPEKVPGLHLTPESCLARAVAVGPRCEEVVTALLAERPVDRLRAVHRLLQLAERFTPARLERACARAVRYDELSVRSIRRILEMGLEAAPHPAEPEASSASAETTAVSDWPCFARRPEELVPPTSAPALSSSEPSESEGE